MKKYLYPFLFLLSTMLLLASTGDKKITYKNFFGDKFSAINDTLYACIYEVTNEEYRQFLATLSSSEYEKCKVDSSEWVKRFPHSYNEPMEKNYHLHQAFNQYPVVNISWYAANKYCVWLTNKHKKINGRQVIFRLPTSDEWNLAAHANPATQLPYPNLNGKTSDPKVLRILSSATYPVHETGGYLQNVGYIKGDSLILAEDGAFYTNRIDAYVPNDFGLYNMIGNAAEMIDAIGLEKGGGWMDTLSNCGVDKIQNYQEPDPRVGFRVFASLAPQISK